MGQNYNGLEWHAKNETPLPTIEEELWKALKKAYLISPTKSDPHVNEGEVTWEGCDYSKCGRTDKGVSAFGQVIGIRLRSNIPPGSSAGEGLETDSSSGCHSEEQSGGSEIRSRSIRDKNGVDFHPSALCSQDANLCSIDDEIPYAQVLNRLLPPDIRVLAWCPSPPPDFNARFSCKERRYKYFFTQPAFSPTRGTRGMENKTSVRGRENFRREGWMDIEAMREGAKQFEGLHDFRNFCKIDASKQLDNFERRIFFADVEELPPDSGPAGYINLPDYQERPSKTSNNPCQNITPVVSNSHTPKIYTFTLHGSGFLWHQVRHMVAILFLIGQGLESPSLIGTLLDIHQTPERPMYDMADDAPLVLWDCIFPREGRNQHEDGLDWVYVGEHTGNNTNHISRAEGEKRGSGMDKHGLGGVVDDLWKVWRHRKIDEVLAGRLLDVVAVQGNPSQMREDEETPHITALISTRSGSQKVFLGDDTPRPVGRYVPVLAKPRMASVQVLNARYAARKGFEQDARVRDQGFRRVKMGLQPDSHDVCCPVSSTRNSHC